MSALPQSQPVAGRPLPAGKASDIATILANLHNLLQMDQVGKLTVIQQNQLRQLLTSQTSQVVLHALQHGRPNPLLSLPAHLDPTQPWEHGPAVTSKEKFEADIAMAVSAADAHVKKNNANRALPPEILSLAELRDCLAIEASERMALFDANPVAKARFTNSVAYWTKRSEQQRATAAASQARSLNSRPAVNAAASGSVQGPGRLAPTGSTGATTNPGIPSVLVDPPMKLYRPPEPLEDESTKRKRKLREFMGEWAPGMDLELGVTDMLSDVLDSFVTEAAHGSIRVAKHRKSDKVELKDASFYLDHTYGITVPGFNAQPSRRIHLAPEGERKRGRVVVPRTAKVSRTMKDDE